jgi:putative ABC transport system substrate-binding protein
MRRREFIGLLGGAAAAWPIAARAQQTAMPLVGFLHQGERDANTFFVKAFLEGLRDQGFVDGRNVRTEYRWADGQYDRLPGLTEDLVRLNATVISATYFPAAVAAKRVTSTVPIVFVVGTDPVEAKLVQSINRPGGNATGVHQLILDLSAKRLELLREISPKMDVVALLANPTNLNTVASVRELEAAARAMGLRLEILEITNTPQFDAALDNLAQVRPGALIVPADVFLQDRRQRIALTAAQLGIPAIYYERIWAAAGGLMSYGPDNNNAYRQAGVYAGRVLKGEKPGDLPVIQPTKFELVLNLKTAKAMGLDIPAKILALADEVIE